MKIYWITIKRFGSWVLLLSTLGFIIYFFGSDWDELAVLGQIRPHHVALLILLQIAYLVVYGHRLQIVFEKCSERRIGYGPWFRIYILSRFLNTVVPQLGNLYRGVRLKADHEVTYTRYVAAFVSFSWMSMWVNMVFAAVVILSTEAALRLGTLPAWQVVLALIALLAAGPFAVDLLFRKTSLRIRGLTWLHAKLSEVTRVSVESLRDLTYIGRFLIGSFVQFIVVCVIFYFCFDSLGIRIDVSQIALFYVLLQLTSYVSLTPGNIGVQEIVFGLLGEYMNIGMSEGILVSALLRVTGYIALYGLALPMGGLGVLRKTKAYRSLE